MIDECALCGGPHLRYLSAAGHFRESRGSLPDQHYFICRDCGLIALRPLLPENALEQRYMDARLPAGTTYEQGLAAARAEIASIRAAKKIKRGHFWRLASEIYSVCIGDMQPGRILDIGCGIGAELLALNREGWDVYGSDLNRVAIAALNECFPGHFRISDGEFGGWNERFDVIMMNQVLEHLVTPQPVLRGLAGLLKPHGRLVIVTPNACSWARRIFVRRWVQYWPPEHVALYGPNQIRRLLRDCGWQPQRVKTFAAPGTDYALSVRQLLHLPLEPKGWEKLPWFSWAWASTFFGHGSELVAVAIPAEC